MGKALTLLLALIMLMHGNYIFADSANNKTLNTEFQRITESFLGGEITFQCGDTMFKITSGIIGSPKLFWRSGLQWVELDMVDFKDTGVVLYGLGREGGLPMTEYNFDTLIPIFNNDNFGITRSAGRYFYKIKSGEYVPYEHQIDFISEKIIGENLQKIVEQFRLDAALYKKEQAWIDQLSISGEEKSYNEKHRHIRDQDIAKIIDMYKDSMEISTDLRSYKTVDSCALLK
ncbi:hypothetical protein I6L39_08670 [Aeromonas sp. FDAARGOS 1409]|uniref:hypothetical protein n=1 Tax=Aeromonas TaxID=642 RepID=UPI001C24CD32|nr:hypothetical protein [Aeromonas sp. FDAARGOS 1409]QXC31733.1 hypothetical protein I6L39_08670 [Aeromonas sp. FDAARGOS 1409]